MLLSELLRSLHCVSYNLTSCDIPIMINGLSVDFVGSDLVERDGYFLNLRIQPSQVEDHQSETQLS